MLIHPTPAEIRLHVASAIRAAADAWEAETGKLFPTYIALRGLDEGIRNANAEHEAMKARLHNGRDAA